MKPLSAGDARIWEGISEATSAEDVDDQPALVADVGSGANVGTVMSVLFSMKTISLVTIYAGPLLIGIGYALVAVAVPLICLEAFGPRTSAVFRALCSAPRCWAWSPARRCSTPSAA